MLTAYQPLLLTLDNRFVVIAADVERIAFPGTLIRHNSNAD
jgi:hypothetical protein